MKLMLDMADAKNPMEYVLEATPSLDVPLTLYHLSASNWGRLLAITSGADTDEQETEAGGELNFGETAGGSRASATHRHVEPSPEASPALDGPLDRILESSDFEDLAAGIFEAATRLRVEEPLVELNLGEKLLASWPGDEEQPERPTPTKPALVRAGAPGRGLISVTIKSSGTPSEQDARALSIIAHTARHIAETIPGKRRDSIPTGEFIGTSAQILDVKQQIQEVAPADGLNGRELEHVLITGESGTGKEVVARLIHTLSGRRDRDFVPVNMSTVGTEEMADSSIFGHLKGSYTGAVSARKGKIGQAEDGTLFLDEIGEASAGVQAKLLRVLEYGDYTRVGSDEPQMTNVRCIMATNRNIHEQDRFRDDLFHRCAHIHLPPLRSRRDDIPSLARHFAARLRLEISDAAVAYFQGLDWPGNVRQLLRAIKTLKREGDGLVTTERAYRAWLRVSKPEAPGGEAEISGTASMPSPILAEGKTVVQQVRELEATLLRSLFEQTGSVSRCKKRAGYNSGNTLRARLKEFGIFPKD